MKTTTYLRFSLLIPFVVWGFCLVVFFSLAGFLPLSYGNGLSTPETLVENILLFVFYYVLGIFIWIFPYGLLALILFLWSFIGKPRTMLTIFALSPLAMTILTTAILIIMDLGEIGAEIPFSQPQRLDADFFSFNAQIAGISLAWGYICVGIGFAVYKMLQHLGYIKDETRAAVLSPLHEPA